MLDRRKAIRGRDWSPRLKDFRRLFFLCRGCNTNEVRVINCPSHLKRATGLCISCGVLAGIKPKTKPFEALYNKFKQQAGYRELPVHLTFEDFVKFTKKSCHYCRKALKWSKRIGRNTPINLDRKNNTKGYSRNNSVACCGLCNEIKGDHLTYSEMMLLMPALRKIAERRLAELS